MIDPVEAIAAALQDKRPLVLFAGQNHDPSTDSILADFTRHLGTADCSSGWRSALDHGISSAQMEWLSERFDRNVPSDTVAPIYDVAWSAVFTSSIDPRLARRFETRGRQPESVLSRDTYARVPRSRSRPPIYYLLGKSDETGADERAPRKHSDLHRRLGHATELLNRIADTATVRGLVVITGYAPDKDWMQADWLLAPLSNGVSPTVLWFDFRGAPNSTVADEMIREGSVITTRKSLASAISQLESSGLLDLETAAGPDEPGMVSMDGGVLDITPALRLRVEASAAIVDDGWTEEPEPLEEHDSDDAFRRFHSTPGNFRLLLEGVARGYAIERTFEQVLWRTVNSRVKRLGQPDSDAVVILHGQSGTGKSVALARLIRKIRLKLRLPVVVATDRIPIHADIEEFCRASERLNAPATVLICDSNQAPQRYEELASALRSRGRRLLIVGTCYRLDAAMGGLSDRFIEAPARVDNAESSAFECLQSAFVQHDMPPTSGAASSIFAMLYRRLPPSRGRLAAGVSSEARNTEGTLRQRARSIPRRTVELPALAQELIKAGLVSDKSLVFAEDDTLAAIGQDWAGRLIDYVMAPGRLNCPVPADLVFRKLSQFDILELEHIISLFSDLDLFRWKQDEEGSDFLIAPRLQIEADLICRRRLNTEQEIGRLVDLICSARPGIEKRAERSFLLNLLFKLDREGPRGEVYQSGYLQFADALKRVRERHGLTDPDLILRECVLRRRAVRTPGRAYDEHLNILNQARETVDRTLEEIDKGLWASARTKRSLVSERAAIYGYLAVQRARSNTDKSYWSDYLAASVASERAIGIDQSYYPIDISLWAATDVLELKKDELSTLQREELRANLYAAIDLGAEVVGAAGGRRGSKRVVSQDMDVVHNEGDLDDSLSSAHQKVRYFKRRSLVARAVGDQELDDKTLRELDHVAPAVATYLVARREAEGLYENELGSESEIRRVAGNAADYISRRVDSGFELDVRCLRLLLQLRWSQATGERLLLTQRGGTPAERVPRQELLGIVSDLNERAGSHARSRERFLEAVLSWLLEDASRAIDIWKSLSHDTEYQDSSRVVRWLVMTDKNGAPCQFRGRLERRSDTYWVRVEGMSRSIRLLANEFANDDLDDGRELRGFGIAFNYIGPLADPLSRPMRRR